MAHRIAYLALNTYPETAPDAAILACTRWAADLGWGLQVSTFALDIPPTVSPVGGFLINLEGMAQAAEEHSKAECQRLQNLINAAWTGGSGLFLSSRQVLQGGGYERAAAEARGYDLVLLPWSKASMSTQDLAEAMIFGSGIPSLLVPAETNPVQAVAPVERLAIAWDGSRVAARALWEALQLFQPEGAVQIITVSGEKSGATAENGQFLRQALQQRGYRAEVIDVELAGRTISQALQETAMGADAQVLAMGGFGHSRLRDFVLGGATKGVLTDLRLPVFLAH